MDTTSILLVILLSLTPHGSDKESAPERKARMTTVAESITLAVDAATCTGSYEDDEECVPVTRADPNELMAALLTLGLFESAYARHVHENRCNWKGGECDGGRAKSPWQFQRTMPTRHAWDAYRSASQDDTDLAAWTAVKLLAAGRMACGSWAGAFGQYATGKTCKWAPGEKRAEYTYRVLAKIKVAQKP